MMRMMMITARNARQQQPQQPQQEEGETESPLKKRKRRVWRDYTFEPRSSNNTNYDSENINNDAAANECKQKKIDHLLTFYSWVEPKTYM